MIGAATPIVSYEGVRPMTRLPAAARPTASIIDSCRPLRSATQPNTKPPNGRARKPTANTASVFSTSDAASPLWKNWTAMYAVNVA